MQMVVSIVADASPYSRGQKGHPEEDS